VIQLQRLIIYNNILPLQKSSAHGSLMKKFCIACNCIYQNSVRLEQCEVRLQIASWRSN